MCSAMATLCCRFVLTVRDARKDPPARGALVGDAHLMDLPPSALEGVHSLL